MEKRRLNCFPGGYRPFPKCAIAAEEIVQDFPSLDLGDVYPVLGYYLKHGSELREYLSQRAREEQKLLAARQQEWSPPCLRQRLLARRNAP